MVCCSNEQNKHVLVSLQTKSSIQTKSLSWLANPRLVHHCLLQLPFFYDVTSSFFPPLQPKSNPSIPPLLLQLLLGAQQIFPVCHTGLSEKDPSLCLDYFTSGYLQVTTEGHQFPLVKAYFG